MLDLNEIKQDHEIATQPQWWGDPDRCKATARLLEQIPVLVTELREARAEIERLGRARVAIGHAFDWLWGFWDGNTLIAARASDLEEIQKAFEQLANSIEED